MRFITLFPEQHVMVTVRATIVLLIAMTSSLTGCVNDEARDRHTTTSAVDADHGGEVHSQMAAGDKAGARDLVRLAAAEIEEFEIELRTAGPGEMRVERVFPGEVRVNEDRFAHVTPRVSGVVRSVHASLGDWVKAGAVIAVLESRELADLKAAYLAALERTSLAESNHAREERLFQRKISSEQEYLEAKQHLAEERIELRSAEQKLIALGLPEEYIGRLQEESALSLTRYSLTAPLNGTVVQKHITQGEALNADAEAFAVADLSIVWIDLSIYQKDMGLIREGQEVAISSGALTQPGKISYVRPIVGEDTRTALARVELSNPNGQWMPGMFVSGLISVDARQEPVVVPRSALLQVEGETVVFVRTAEGFTTRVVTVGAENADHVSITSGLSEGDEYVASGGFALKSELQKSEVSGGQDH